MGAASISVSRFSNVRWIAVRSVLCSIQGAAKAATGRSSPSSGCYVNLLPRRAQGYDLLQKGNELTAGVPGSGFGVDAPSDGIESRIPHLDQTGLQK